MKCGAARHLCSPSQEEVRRRERVVRIFPTRTLVIRLLGALLMGQDEQWSTGKRYLDMRAYRQWRHMGQTDVSSPVSSSPQHLPTSQVAAVSEPVVETTGQHLEAERVQE
jgi:transposase-like protein